MVSAMADPVTDIEALDRARELIAGAGAVCVLTGAGVSQESGIPTFRGADGLWRQYRAEELATPQAFHRDPKLVWEWYDWRRQKISEAKPNPGHHALVELERRVERFTLITQNVDGLHKVAGSKNVIELHGNIWQIRCTVTGTIEENREVPLGTIPPRCKATGHLARPNVVWFGEMIPAETIRACVEAVEECDVMLIVGTSGVVEPAASLGFAAKSRNKPVIEINLDPTPNSQFYDVTLRGRSGEILPRLISS